MRGNQRETHTNTQRESVCERVDGKQAALTNVQKPKLGMVYFFDVTPMTHTLMYLVSSL